MITPRRTRLIRVPDLPAFQRAIAVVACDADSWRARDTAILVANRAAGGELRRALENRLLPGDSEGGTRAFVLPAILTRGDWYTAMHAAIADAPRWLSDLEREVLIGCAAREATRSGARPPFRLRAGLLVEILAFHDALTRLRRSIDAFERLVTEDLLPRVEIDRGAARMLDQTRFLVATFREYQRRVASSGGLDEHALRDRLLDGRASSPFRRLVVTVGDRAGDLDGLWPADFDLLTRVGGLEAIDVVATERALASGFADRLLDVLPGIEIEEMAATSGAADGSHSTILAPAGSNQGPFWRSRDREEELLGVARRIKRDRTEPLARTAIVFRRPLPYIYLAQTVLESSGLPYYALDALPLAAEPYASAVDLVFSFVTSGFGRTQAIALLSSPFFLFEAAGRAIGRSAAATLGRVMSEAALGGGVENFAQLAAGAIEEDALRRAGARADDGSPFRLAASAALEAAGELEPLTRPRPASVHLDVLSTFLSAHHRAPLPGDQTGERHLRSRGAILGAIDELRAAHLRYDDPTCSLRGVAARLERWMESQTFAPAQGRDGVRLVDAQAARYADVDEIHLVGLVDGEWPARPSRNVFYPPFLLGQLGWSRDADALQSARAAFDDLVHLARRVALSTFTLEDDAIVEPSLLLEDVERAGLPVHLVDDTVRSRICPDDALTEEPFRPDALQSSAARWAVLRSHRTEAGSPAFHGQASAAARPAYTVSAIEEYAKCPFRYFARHVLHLREETDDEEALLPRARGIFLHEVLQAFFDAWQQAGRGAITADDLADAKAMFAPIANEFLGRLPPGEREVARVRLLGSPFLPGAAEMVARLEAEQPIPVVERLLEFRLEGPCTFEVQGERREVTLGGVVDRIDLMADGTFRLFDYKLGRPPSPRYAVQLPVYAVHARQALDGHHGRSWSLRDASYVAFAGPDHVVSLASSRKGLVASVEEGQARLVDAVDGIARGEFPPRPADVHLCASCPYSAVCRKEYVGDK